jgi:diguanylate cyclase (GGDEF)-like protein/putative nucleotidyltransferase with HDIG domain
MLLNQWSFDRSTNKGRPELYWWAIVVVGAAVSVVSGIGLQALSGDQWLKLALLAGMVALTSRHPIRVPNYAASISVSDVFIFLGLFFLGIGPAVLLGWVDTLVVALRNTRQAANRILAPNLMATSVLFSSLAFKWTLTVLQGSPPEWPIANTSLPLKVLAPAVVVLALVQYLMNAGLIAWLHGRRSGSSAYQFWRRGLLWTSWVFFAAAFSAVVVLVAIERNGFIYVAVAVPVTAATYLSCRAYFEQVNEKTRHLEEVNRLHLATVEALASAIDAKDQTTHGHVRRVQIYAEGMASLYNLSEAEVEALRVGALLHDVGKLAVPDHILNKPGKLTAAEFDRMKIHTIVGAQIMQRVGFPYPVVPIVRHHHERWDGKGYPDALKGEEIPITARIISVVDCFDALHEDRQYRRALTREQAIDFIRRVAGSQFDPKVVALFIEHLPEFEARVREQGVDESEPEKLSLPESASGALPAAGLSQERLDLIAASTTDYREAIRRAHQEVYALYEVARTFGSSLNIEDAMAIIANKLGYVVKFDTCAIYRYHDATGIAIAEHVSGAHADYLRGRKITPGEGITGYVLANLKALANTDPMLDFAELDLPTGVIYRSVAVFPLQRDGKLLGALALYRMAAENYSNDDLRLLETVARIASDALHNAIRYADSKADAMTDLLTDLPNARGLQLRFEQHVLRAAETGTSLFLLMFDLDSFKPINDRYGHQLGDEFLKGISLMLSLQFREEDFFARYAGDEFIALVVLTEEQCEALKTRVRRSVDQFSFCVRPMKYVRVGVSIGSAQYGPDGTTIDELLFAADRAMYANKHNRKTHTEPESSNLVTPNPSDQARPSSPNEPGVPSTRDRSLASTLQ